MIGKKKNIIMMLVSAIIVTFLIIVILTSQNNNNDVYSTYNYETPSYLKTYTVTYRVEGWEWETVDITMENQYGGTSQYTNQRLPFVYHLYGMHEGDFVYISAQVNGDACIEAQIYLDDILVKKSQSCGEYVIATCSGII